MEIVNRNIKNKGITQRIGMTLILVILSRLGTFIPIPGVDHDAFYQSISTNPIVSFLNVFSGGGFASIGIFALGIVPYINASIVMQLATTSIPSLEKLQKEEEWLKQHMIYAGDPGMWNAWLKFQADCKRNREREAAIAQRKKIEDRKNIILFLKITGLILVVIPLTAIIAKLVL